MTVRKITACRVRNPAPEEVRRLPARRRDLLPIPTIRTICSRPGRTPTHRPIQPRFPHHRVRDAARSPGKKKIKDRLPVRPGAAPPRTPPLSHRPRLPDRPPFHPDWRTPCPRSPRARRLSRRSWPDRWAPPRARHRRRPPPPANHRQPSHPRVRHPRSRHLRDRHPPVRCRQAKHRQDTRRRRLPHPLGSSPRPPGRPIEYPHPHPHPPPPPASRPRLRHRPVRFLRFLKRRRDPSRHRPRKARRHPPPEIRSRRPPETRSRRPRETRCHRLRDLRLLDGRRATAPRRVRLLRPRDR